VALEDPRGSKTPASESSLGSEIRDSVSAGIRWSEKDVFSALSSSNSSSLLGYLISIALKPLLAALTSGSSVHTVFEEIWKGRAEEVQQKLLEPRSANLNLAEALLKEAQADYSMAHILEDLFVFVDLVPSVEKHWSQKEWLLFQLKRELQPWHHQNRFLRLSISLPSELTKPQATARGALQLQTSASKPLISAGEEFSIFVVIRNPFDVPVTLYTVETQIPVDLVDVVWQQRRRTALLAEDPSLQRSRSGLLADALRVTWDRWRLALKLSSEAQPRIAQAITAGEGAAQEIPLRVESKVVVERVQGGTVTGVHIDEFQPINIASVSPSHVDSVLWRLTAFKSGVVPVVLQPGDSVVKQFVFRTQSWLLFTPVAHSLRIELRYSVDDRDHIAAVPFDLTIQAALTATMSGAVAGGVVGGIARSLSTASSSSAQVKIQLISVILAAILSGIAVVSFARKNAAQQIISVEDFWGGLFLGFLIGFFGQEFAVNILNPGG
jgi:hypothetical protein